MRYIILVIGIIVIIQLLSRRGNYNTATISSLVRRLKMPTPLQGFISGASIYSKRIVFLLSDELVYVSQGRNKETIRIRYSDITSIQLKGWLCLYFSILSNNDDRELRISPISEFNVRLLENANTSPSVIVDMPYIYQRYTAPFRRFIEILHTKGVDKDALQVRWVYIYAKIFLGYIACIVIGSGLLTLITWLLTR